MHAQCKGTSLHMAVKQTLCDLVSAEVTVSSRRIVRHGEGVKPYRARRVPHDVRTITLILDLGRSDSIRPAPRGFHTVHVPAAKALVVEDVPRADGEGGFYPGRSRVQRVTLRDTRRRGGDGRYDVTDGVVGPRPQQAVEGICRHHLS